MISNLPPELKEYIYSYCALCDLLSLGYCSKGLNASVKRALWKCVRLPWDVLSKKTLPDIVANLRYTCRLSVYEKKFDKSREDDFAKLLDEETFNSNISRNYVKMLGYCNSYKLRRLDISGVPVNLDVKQTVDVLKNLRELSLKGTDFQFEWNHLHHLHHLKKVSFENCKGITDQSIREIVKCDKLEEVHFKICVAMRDDSLRHVSSLSNLKRMSIFNNTFISPAAFKHLDKIHHLVHLHFESTLINDESLLHLSQHLINLKVLKLIGSCKISDHGFGNINRLRFLLELDIKMCWRITGNCFQHIKSLPLLQKLSFTSIDLTDAVFSNLLQLRELREVDITNVESQLCDGIVERFCARTGMRKHALGSKVYYSNYSHRKYQTVFLRKE